MQIIYSARERERITVPILLIKFLGNGSYTHKTAVNSKEPSVIVFVRTQEMVLCIRVFLLTRVFA